MTLHSTDVLRTVLLLLACCVGSFVLLGTLTLPADNLTYSSIQNFGHFLLFAVLGYIVLKLVSNLLQPRVLMAVVVSAVILIALGLGVELFQKGLDGRTASLSDLILDVAGIVVGFLVFLSIGLWRKGERFAIPGIALAILIVSLLSARSVIGFIGFDLFRPSLPIVRDFHHPFAVKKIEAAGDAEFELATLVTQNGDSHDVLRVRFSGQQYNGVIFHESDAKWSDYETLSINIFSALPTTTQIALRINDALHNNQYLDRYNGVLSISPGFNEVLVPLTTIASMGNNPQSERQMDIDDVSRVQIFVGEVAEPFVLDIVKIKLL